MRKWFKNAIHRGKGLTPLIIAGMTIIYRKMGHYTRIYENVACVNYKGEMKL